MAEGKWITDLVATTPLVDAARRVLSLRLQVVHDHLPLALHHWKTDPEHVHQLRVGTRRAGAALNIFADCLPVKVLNKTRKHLRRLRRAAGAARDWDVFAQDLTLRELQATQAQRPGLDFLLGYVQAQRVAAQEVLEDVGAHAPFDLERVIAKAVAAVRSPRANRQYRVLRDLARPWLSDALAALHADAAGQLERYENLHGVRIRGKRLRYGMEVFASCFTGEFKDRFYPAVEEMQEMLGLANDSHVASQRLVALRDVVRSSQPDIWKRAKAGIEGLVRYHQRRVLSQRRHFLDWWSNWQESGSDAALTGMVHSSV